MNEAQNRIIACSPVASPVRFLVSPWIPRHFSHTFLFVLLCTCTDPIVSRDSRRVPSYLPRVSSVGFLAYVYVRLHVGYRFPFRSLGRCTVCFQCFTSSTFLHVYLAFSMSSSCAFCNAFHRISSGTQPVCGPVGFQVSSRWVPDEFPMSFQCVPGEFPMNSRWIPDMFPVVSRSPPGVFPVTWVPSNDTEIPLLLRFSVRSFCCLAYFPSSSFLQRSTWVPFHFPRVPSRARYVNCYKQALCFPTGSRWVPSDFWHIPQV